MSMFSWPLHSINVLLLIWMCVMCVCCVCEYRQCPEHIIAASCVVNDCTGNSNMHSSSFGIPLPQGGPQTSARRRGEKTHEKNTKFWTAMSPSSPFRHMSRLPGSSLKNWTGLSQSLTVCTRSPTLCVHIVDLLSLASATANTLQILT